MINETKHHAAFGRSMQAFKMDDGPFAFMDNGAQGLTKREYAMIHIAAGYLSAPAGELFLTDYRPEKREADIKWLRKVADAILDGAAE